MTYTSCISFDSYIKPQLFSFVYRRHLVVYLLIPTSNHNDEFLVERLPFVVYLLIPTSNHNDLSGWNAHERLYIFWFLHQTTTVMVISWGLISCISFDSYIKPQLSLPMGRQVLVVYLLIPTSNHNGGSACLVNSELYIFWFLHQTTTFYLIIIMPDLLYIFWFLHQTTTILSDTFFNFCCISFDSYIKPQLFVHVLRAWEGCISFDSYIKPQHGCPSKV